MTTRNPLLPVLAGLTVVGTGLAQPRSQTVMDATPVKLPGVETTLSVDAQPSLSVDKPGAERRLAAVNIGSGDWSWAKSIRLQGSVSGTIGTARLAVLAWSGESCWYRLGTPLRVGPEAAYGVSLEALKPAAFNADPAAAVDWKKVDQIWLGVVLDGPAKATLTVAPPEITAEPLRPTAPLTVPLAAAAKWNMGKDPAVQHKAAVVNEGPDGAPALRLDVTYPEARHLYSMLSGPIEGEDLGSYRTLRIRYRATLPKGPNLLFSLQEPGGGQYIIDPPPAQTTEWKTLDIAIADLKLAGWTKDADGKLSMDQGVSLQIGCHGTANPPGAGSIWIAEVCLVP
ncbi:MAG: hypothetical protein HZB16_10080 [Armatimonadetes bacterium]|nr:hypothetical protein [Armatimonadota bacterium]